MRPNLAATDRVDSLHPRSGRINEAYDVLKSYTPPADLRVSRVTASISAILDLGFSGRHESASVRTPVRITIALVLLAIVLLLLLR